MARYFNYFPTTFYKNSDVNSLDVVTNITAKFAFEPSFKNNTVIFYEYAVADGETPENLAHRFYGSSEKHWIILSMNDIINPQVDWPLNELSLRKMIDIKYSTEEYANNTTQYAGVTWAQQNTKSYFKKETKKINSNGITDTKMIEVDANTYSNVIISTDQYTLADNTVVTITVSKETQSYYDYEVSENEKKRTIKILKPEFASVVEEELIEIFRSK